MAEEPQNDVQISSTLARLFAQWFFPVLGISLLAFISGSISLVVRVSNLESGYIQHTEADAIRADLIAKLREQDKQRILENHLAIKELQADIVRNSKELSRLSSKHDDDGK